MRMKDATFVALVASAVLGAAAPTVAHADTFYLFDQSACCGSGPFGTVETTQNGTTLSVDVELAPNYFLNTGVHETLAFNLVPPGSVDGTSIVDNGTATYSVSTVPTSNPPFGTFNTALNCSVTTGTAGPCGNSLQFDILNFAGFTANIINGIAIWFTADISTIVNGQTLTGVVGATLSQVPLPPALVLFGTALARDGLSSFSARPKSVRSSTGCLTRRKGGDRISCFFQCNGFGGAVILTAPPLFLAPELTTPYCQCLHTARAPSTADDGPSFGRIRTDRE